MVVPWCCTGRNLKTNEECKGKIILRGKRAKDRETTWRVTEFIKCKTYCDAFMDHDVADTMCTVCLKHVTPSNVCTLMCPNKDSRFCVECLLKYVAQRPYRENREYCEGLEFVRFLKAKEEEEQKCPNCTKRFLNYYIQGDRSIAFERPIGWIGDEPQFEKHRDAFERKYRDWKKKKSQDQGNERYPDYPCLNYLDFRGLKHTKDYLHMQKVHFGFGVRIRHSQRTF